MERHLKGSKRNGLKVSSADLGLSPGGAQALSTQHPACIALSNRVLEKIDKEALKQKRSRSEFVELHFETLFSAQK